MNNYTYYRSYSTDLYHHGVKGMHWGVRKDRSKTRTAATYAGGSAGLSVASGLVTAHKVGKQLAKQSFNAGTDFMSINNAITKDQAARMVAAITERIKKATIDSVSNGRLNKAFGSVGAMAFNSYVRRAYNAGSTLAEPIMSRISTATIASISGSAATTVALGSLAASAVIGIIGVTAYSAIKKRND